MSDFKVRVIIEGRYGEHIAEACLPLDGAFAYVIQPLKQSDCAFPMFDTPPGVVRRTRIERDDFAKIMTPKLAKCLLDAMSANDTFNGYSKEELAAIGRATTTSKDDPK